MSAHGRAAWLSVLLAAGLAATAAAQSRPAPDSIEESAARAATKTVMRQLEAFRRGDFIAAYAFASAEIKRMVDHAGFERMVTGGYPEIARSVSAVVTDRRPTPNGGLYLHLSIRGENGSAVEALYEMVREDGAWKINGVVTRPDTSQRTQAPPWSG